MENVERFRHKISFLSKESIKCPVCQKEFFHENLMFGGGRLIAGDITEMLHRIYKPSQTYGKIYPLVYPILVCPDCFYASMSSDFDKVPEDKIEILKDLRDERIEFANKLIGEPADFSRYRTLKTGAVSYVLATRCYDHFTKKAFPVIKQAICSIRAAYLFDELETEEPDNYFKFVAETFYKKALFFYKHAVDLNQKKEQIMENLKVMGPDIDKDYGYDGVTYLIAALTYIYGSKENPTERKKDLEEARLYFGKLFGMGKSNVNKPKEILERSKDFYDLITKEMK
ncbi:MAG: hypothetical protein A2086_09640 [Spirochaetes bacterium GWD1_27_9]|nr:MAG: hypothetical protein A2Z98_13565 [Spirochaetes bacterium GWB1_27_13]OHD25985.1 MAG: hypothetical protein A2Y34_07070 [Spirochaetes bacterium GWC1_27_15]OHD31663.1 MAG: hypothetical protein A2086_09640 [Spirochaetes bacterium GWD1_27_9]